MQTTAQKIECADLDAAIGEHEKEGFRLDMVFPADDPREAMVSRGEEHLRLQRPARSKGTAQDNGNPYSVGAAAAEGWIKGRAGMEYRDLIPDRMGGKVIASHIRLTEGGEVADYVHYHKIDFQVIYCLKGRIKVVYEDQGEPFWLETGDCVLQPPEIRHRVMECAAGSEVIEITTPAEHETWVEHNLTLPNSKVDTERQWSGQRFFRCGSGSDARSAKEQEIVEFARSLSAALSDIERLDVIIAFSQSLCQK